MNDGKRKIDSDYTGKPSAGAPIVMTSKIRAVLYYLISFCSEESRRFSSYE